MDDLDRKLQYEYLGRNTDGALGQIYRLLARPRLHFGGANRACQEIIAALREKPTPEKLVEAHYAIDTLEESGWSMFTRSLRLAVAEAELPVDSVPFVEGLSQASRESLETAELIAPRVEVIDVTEIIVHRILADPQEVFRITPEQFEELICNRLVAMGLDATRTGSTYQKDGGIDVVSGRNRPLYHFLALRRLSITAHCKIRWG